MKNPRNALSFQIDPKSAVPVYEQAKQAVKLAILSGNLTPGERLPSLRELAAMLRVNPNTVVKVYFQLEVEGFIASQAGSGFYVTKNPRKTSAEARRVLERMTEDYLGKAVALGFTAEDIIACIRERQPAPLRSAEEECRDYD